MALPTFNTTWEPKPKTTPKKPDVEKTWAATSPRGRVNQMYERNLEILAKTMRDRAEQELANVEARGVLRSGEADRMATRRAEDEATQKRYLAEDKAYDLARIKDATMGGGSVLSSRSGGSGGGGGGTVSGTPTSQQLLDQWLALFSLPAPVAPTAKPVGQRLIVLPKTRTPGTIQTTRQRAM